MATTRPVFPNYLQIPTRVPQWAWHALRVVSVVSAITLSIVLIVRPQLGLLIWWGVVVPSLPLLFFIAPGLWRNICPLAAANQTPRLFRFTRGLTQPRWLKEYAYVIGI